MTERRDLLFEIGTEELPPKSLLMLRDALARNVAAGLERAALEYVRIKAFATPRRLALLIEALSAGQPGRIVERRGPALQAAFREDGQPTPAAVGFAKSCGTAVERLGTVKTEKGEWLSFSEHLPGTAAEVLLPQILTEGLAALPIAKRMRWGSGSVEFVRPVHWAVLLFGGEPLEAAILGQKTGRESYGHRFHHPGPIVLASPEHYCERLAAEGRVIVDFDERRDRIERLAVDAAKGVGGLAKIDRDLLNEVTALVEWPVAVPGRFDRRFLTLPREVLVTTLETNQKAFPVEDTEGRLLPHFIAISNIESVRPDAVREGNERVVRPRLEDAEFFWRQDRNNTLESRVVALSGIVFQERLGTLADKARRVEDLAQRIAVQIDFDAVPVRRAALLAKADLLTAMVGEFPNLQGTMGRYYALADGEPDEIAAAIEEHYWPKQSGGPLPRGRIGQVLALADKLDTLVGIFSIGLTPSGERDPYALRRAALGVLRIIIEKHVDLDLPPLIEFAATQFDHEFDHDVTRDAVCAFCLERLRGYCLERGYRADEFDAVASVGPGRPMDFELRLQAVRSFQALPEAESLARANKRIRNILRKSDGDVTASVSASDLIEPEEQALAKEARLAAEALVPMLQARAYTDALCRLAQLRAAVDAFFESVLVMSDDAVLRRNRLALLALIEGLFLRIADIARLQSVR